MNVKLQNRKRVSLDFAKSIARFVQDGPSSEEDEGGPLV